MNKAYSDNRTIQILIAVLKGHGIRKVVVSPGTTNFMFVASIQNDEWFEIRSSADERSAAYIACGWAAETREPVVISCTGATASRNYLPALTEAYYRKLPVLALTSMNNSALPGNNIPQIIDYSKFPADVVKISVSISDVYDGASEKKCVILANKAVLELFRTGGGPAHIHLMTKMSDEFNTKTLPVSRIIKRYQYADTLPDISIYARIGIYLGSHDPFSKELTEYMEGFCNQYHSVVLCDHTSNYKGKHRFHSSYVAAQEYLRREDYVFDLIIDLGEVSGDYYQFDVNEVWRVSVDGEIKDRFGKLTNVFEMDEKSFFRYYSALEVKRRKREDMLKKLTETDEGLRRNTPDLPFSNIWIAKNSSMLLPMGSVVHFGILNSLRAWNFFEIPESVYSYCNVGGFGIDGGLSSLIGASFADDEKLYFCFLGDLAFFYDLNAIGNRHVGNNVRIMVINNGKGTEFRNYSHPAAVMGNAADDYVAAAGHYGEKSHSLLRHYAEDLKFQYLAANNKNEFLEKINVFMEPRLTAQPILMEVFTDSEDESKALNMIRTVIPQPKAKALLKNAIGEKHYKAFAKKMRRK